MTTRAAPSREGARLPAAVRIWFAILLVLVFACGLLSGLLARKLLADSGTVAVVGTDREFYELFVREFDLDPRQRAQLRLILEERSRRLEQWKNDLMHRVPDLQARLHINRQPDQLVPEILDKKQRARYQIRLREQ